MSYGLYSLDSLWGGKFILLEINNIDDAWLKWRKLEKFKDLNFETTLAEQVNKYRKSDQFTSFSRLIQYRIKKNQTQ